MSYINVYIGKFEESIRSLSVTGWFVIKKETALGTLCSCYFRRAFHQTVLTAAVKNRMCFVSLLSDSQLYLEF